MSFFESFEEYCARVGATCSCSAKRIWPWEHAEECQVAAAHVGWVRESNALWDRLRFSPSFDPKIFEKAAAGFR